MSRFITYFMAGLLLFASCKKEDKMQAIDYTNYFYPLDSGRYWIFIADSVSYDNNTSPSTVKKFSFQVKQQVGESFTDNTGNIIKRLLRFSRDNDSAAWMERSSYFISQRKNEFLVTEDNNTYVKLNLPLDASKSWDGNIYRKPPDNLGRDPFFIKNYLQNDTINGMIFTNTITVQEILQIDFIDEINKTSTYALGIGPVFLLSDTLNIQPNHQTGNIDTAGYRLRLALKSYGK